MKILTEKQQLELKIEELNSTFLKLDDECCFMSRKLIRKHEWGSILFYLPSFLTLQEKYKELCHQKKLICEYRDMIISKLSDLMEKQDPPILDDTITTTDDDVLTMTTYNKVKKVEEMMNKMGIHFESWTHNTIVVVDSLNKEESYVLDQLKCRSNSFPTFDNFSLDLKDIL